MCNIFDDAGLQQHISEPLILSNDISYAFMVLQNRTSSSLYMVITMKSSVRRLLIELSQITNNTVPKNLLVKIRSKRVFMAHKFTVLALESNRRVNSERLSLRITSRSRVSHHLHLFACTSRSDVRWNGNIEYQISLVQLHLADGPPFHQFVSCGGPASGALLP